MRRGRLMALVAVVVALGAPANVLAFGPGAQDDDRAVANCIAAFERQAERGLEAGGGPKAGEPGPLNCDHYFQGVTQTIGNGWPPPPFQG